VLTFIGSTSALLLGALAVIAARFRKHLPHIGQEIVLVIAIIVMLLAGEEMAYSVGGSWPAKAVSTAKGAGHGWKVILAIIALVLLLTIAAAVRHRIRMMSGGGGGGIPGMARPGGGGGGGGGTAAGVALSAAFFLPLLCAVFPSGVFHNLGTFLSPLAAQLNATIRSGLGL